MLTQVPYTAVPTAAPTILVVDDVDDARDIMARMLRFDGYTPVTAENGEAALAAVEAERPALVLLDLTMPDMDGLEVLRRLRADARHRDLPVVMFSAIHDPVLVAKARQLGAADYIVKGRLGLDELLARVANHLSPAS